MKQGPNFLFGSMKDCGSGWAMSRTFALPLSTAPGNIIDCQRCVREAVDIGPQVQPFVDFYPLPFPMDKLLNGGRPACS